MILEHDKRGVGQLGHHPRSLIKIIDLPFQIGYYSLMKKANISSIKNDLSRYLNYVKQGGRVRILDRQRPVADLIPVERSCENLAEDDEALLIALEADGVIRRGSHQIPQELFEVPPEVPHQPSGSGVLVALLEERALGR